MNIEEEFNKKLNAKKYEKKKLIEEYEEGEEVKDIFVVKFKKGVSPYQKGFSFSLVLTDSSGESMDYRYWGGTDEKKVKEIYDEIKEDSVIHVEGIVSSYKGKLQLTTNEGKGLIKIVKESEYDSEDFIKKGAKDLEELYNKLNKKISGVEDDKIKKLLKNVFNEEFGEKFKKHPAAISRHHNWIGGLLEHTFEVVRYCEVSCEIFSDLDKDLLIAGALLHDIGKVEEMKTTTRIKGTKIGQFVGHLVLGTIFVSKKMGELNFDEEVKEKILHMMVSHHGKEEFGSPKKPMFPEAVALYYADEISSKIEGMFNFIENSKKSTDGDFMYNQRKGCNIFLR